MRKAAILSPCRTYRYTLERAWDDSKPRVLFVLLNPSTADETEDDATLRRGIGFSRGWGCGSVTFVNLFAFRATQPSDLKKASDPVGPENTIYIRHEAAKADEIVLAWGAHGGLLGQDKKVLSLLSEFDLFHLGLTKDGHPKHPLRLRADTELQRWKP